MPLWYQGQSVLQYWNGVTLKLAMSEGLQLNFYAAMTAMSWWERTVSHHYVPSRTQEGPLEMDFLSKHVKAQLGPPLNEEKFLFVCVSRNMINWPLPVKNVGTWSLQARLAGSHGFYVQQGFFLVNRPLKTIETKFWQVDSPKNVANVYSKHFCRHFANCLWSPKVTVGKFASLTNDNGQDHQLMQCRFYEKALPIKL